MARLEDEGCRVVGVKQLLPDQVGDGAHGFEVHVNLAVQIAIERTEAGDGLRVDA